MLREKELEVEYHGDVVLKRWVGSGRDLDWSLYLKDRVTKPDSVNTSDVVMLDTDVPVVQQKNYDLMGDLLEPLLPAVVQKKAPAGAGA